MSNFTEIVDGLEDRIGKLLHNYEVIKQKNHSIQEELASVKNENGKLAEEVKNSENRIQTLKAANALLGSKDYTKETKLKINSLIRDIDQCIVQLSE
jgi:regulator of replication initiation timing